jgi:Skp family chaperone for outer membrane proteins
MKLKFVFLFVFLSTVATASKAQVATVDSKKVFSSMPVFARIDTLVQTEADKYSQEYIKKKLKAQLLLTTIDSLKRLPATEANGELTKRAQTAVQEFRDYEAGANKKIEEYKEILLKPYVDQVNRAIKITAKRLKYKQVLDVQQVSLAYIDVSGDITEAVIAELKKD